MVGRGAEDRVVERIARRCAEPAPERELRRAVLDDLHRAVGFEWFAWLLTDPETEVGSAPLADTPSLADLPRLIRAKYLTALNRWTGLDGPAASLWRATGGELARSLLWREVLSGYGVVDVASVVLRDGHGCWGWLDLWRGTGAGPFTEDDLALLARAAPPVTAALRAAQARAFVAVAPAPEPEGPVVLLLTPGLEVRAQTPGTDAHLRRLLPAHDERPPVPAVAYNVAAQLLAVEAGVDDHPPWARTHLGGGRWLTLRAARVGQAGAPAEREVAVTMEATGPADRRALFARAHALSPREAELLSHLARGADTRTVAQELFLSEHTVQDHLKSIFAKTGLRSRRALVSRLSGG